ncbi:MAG: antitoxin [Chloroflexi bacterium]|nr:antitoxin [Chloroflexota bacterium]
MVKTTVYLPHALKAELERAASERGCSEADLIREGVRLAIAHQTPPRPTIGIFVSDDPLFAEHADAHLAGFGRP